VASIAEQYRTITTTAGWIERGNRGVIRFAGNDARDFLQGLLTNDVSGLSSQQAVYAAYLTPQGRMIADMTLVEQSGAILGLVADGQGASLAARFDLLIFAEAVTVSDASSEFAEIEMIGAGAAALAARAVGLDASALGALPILGVQQFAGGFVLRDELSPFPTYRMFVAAEQREQVVTALESHDTIAISEELATALRIEAGRPLWGADLGDDVIPLEAGLLDRAISTSKGCYVGQEIVIRMLHRGGGRVAKRLVTLAIDQTEETPLPAARSSLLVDGSAVGHLTSVAFSPSRGRVVALGYLRREAAEIGRRVTTGTGLAAEVTGFAR
jgi:folate-binding protein YgfZ